MFLFLISIPSSWALFLPVFLCLTLPLPILSDLSTAPNDITVSAGSKAFFQCASGDQNYPGIGWNSYNTKANATNSKQRLFYVDPKSNPDITYNPNVDSNKYIRNGTYNLIVNNVQISDGDVFGCEPVSGNQGYANLVVIGSLNIVINPQSGVTIGSMITITCTLTYGAANLTNLRKNLDPYQDPSVDILIGGQSWNPYVYRQDANTKVAVVNQTTVTQQFVGADITCAVGSKPQNGAPYYNSTTTSVNIPASPREITIKTINNTAVDPNNLREMDQINCSARGVPTPSISWKNTNYGYTNPSSGNFGSGWCILTLEHARENQNWECIATNSVNTTFASYTFNVKTATGQVVSGNGASSNYGSLLYLALATLSFLVLQKHLTISST